MARVVSYYRAEAQGGATFYAYAQPDDTSSAVRIYRGDLVTLPADYLSQEENSMWPTLIPGGWMFYYNVGNIEAVYEYLPDRCTPPDFVGLFGTTLYIYGGAGSEDNAWHGWEVSWRERAVNEAAWGPWGNETIVLTNESQVEVTPGKVRQFRVRTRGMAGVAYFSDFVVCPTLLNGNTAAGTPTVELPVPGMSCRLHSPWVRVICPPDPDNDPMRLMRSVDGASWTLAANLEGQGGIVIDRLPWLDEGEHAVEYRLYDVNNLGSPVDRAGFTVEPSQWTRDIAPGDVISNDQFSHQADLKELLTAVNGMRAFYGLSEVSLPGTVGRFCDWKAQMETLLQAADEVYQLFEQPQTLPEVPSYPAANIINTLREACQA